MKTNTMYNKKNIEPNSQKTLFARNTFTKHHMQKQHIQRHVQRTWIATFFYLPGIAVDVDSATRVKEESGNLARPPYLSQIALPSCKTMSACLFNAIASTNFVFSSTTQWGHVNHINTWTRKRSSQKQITETNHFTNADACDSQSWASH